MKKQILQLMDYVNDYTIILSQSRGNKSHADMFNNIRSLLDAITDQQSGELKVINE